MKYREQLEQELKQVESQLQRLEKLERSKMRERNQLSKEILKILMKKQKAEKDLKKKREILRNLANMTMSFKRQIQSGRRKALRKNYIERAYMQGI